MITSNEFIQAAREGNKKIVTAYIEENRDNPAAINIKYQDKYNSGWEKDREESALYHAVNEGQLEIAMTLLEVPGIEIENAFIVAVERPLYNNPAKLIREQIFRIKKQTLSHQELCQAYLTKEEFYTDFKPVYESSVEWIYKKYLQLDKFHQVTKEIFLALLAKKPSQQALDKALVKADEELIEILVEAGASLAPWECMNMKPQTTKDKYLHFLAIVNLMQSKIEYLVDNFADQDISILKDITFSFANLLATQAKYEPAAHALYKAAADMNHPTAKNIVTSNYSKPVKSSRPLSPVNLCTQTLWQNRQALPKENLSKDIMKLEGDTASIEKKNSPPSP